MPTVAGTCSLHLEDWGRARRHLGAALRSADPGYARDGALRRQLAPYRWRPVVRQFTEQAAALLAPA